ncbi:MAG: cytochrome c oxidase accessory protein CcoG, partial [Gammaproteobacteria bacterium]|nr:cytochrome c oxidase accessory protein CcoG [Gammaproteobacteria bacterium]
KGQQPQPLYKRARVIIYFSIMLLAASGLLYGLTNLGSFDLKVIHERQPMFVRLSDGSIQNKYILKILNKTDRNMHISIDVDGPDNLETQGLKDKTILPAGKLSSYIIFIRIPKKNLEKDRTPVYFTVHSYESYDDSVEYQSMFYAPKF